MGSALAFGVSGGVCTENGEIKGAIYEQEFTAEEMEEINGACRRANEPGHKNSLYETATPIGNSYLSMATVSISFVNQDGTIPPNNIIKSMFTVKSIPKVTIFDDMANLIAQVFLFISVIGLTVFSLLTLRDWRRGMLRIEDGLSGISNDLSIRIDPPKISELERISTSINGLAENLEVNLSRQKELEANLAQNEKLAALGRVASGVAHEVRNPLASMKLKIQLAERNKFTESKLEKTFSVLLEEINRLESLVRRLLEIARPTKLNLASVSLVKLLKQRLSLITEKAEATNVKIQTDFTDELPPIEADGEKLTQVFDNLLLNALEAMPDGGNLRVSLQRAENLISLKISDTGNGVSEDDRKHLFEPFFTTKDKGTGLGLAISREIIEAHGGKISLAKTREEETGTVFIIEFPIGEAE